MSDLLPPNATKAERALSLSVERILSVNTEAIRQQWSPATCPAATLPWLAWALAVDHWNPDWTEAQKRSAIAASIQVHRIKGTVGAVRRAIEALGYDVTINENTAVAYTFRVELDASAHGLTEQSVYDQARDIALSTKNARSKLLGVDGALKSTAHLCFYVATIGGTDTAVIPRVDQDSSISGDVPTLAGIHSTELSVTI